MDPFFLDLNCAEARLRCGDSSVSVNADEFRVWAISSGIMLHPVSAKMEELVLETEADRLYVSTTWLD